jgi:kinase
MHDHLTFSLITVASLVHQELGLGPSVPLHVVLQDWIRHADGKLSFLGFIKLLHGVSSRLIPKA